MQETRFVIYSPLSFAIKYTALSLSQNPGKAPNQAWGSDFPFYNIFVLQKVPLSKKFDDVILMTSRHAICGLGPPIKYSGYT